MRTHAAVLPDAAPLPEIRQIHSADLRWALAQGWRDLTSKRSDLVFAGLAFALATLIFSVASFPMVVDRPVEAGVALRTSLAAFRRSPMVLLGWGLRVALLLAIGTLLFGVGLAVVLPWLGYATWHLYTRLVVR